MAFGYKVQARSESERRGVEAKENDFIRKAADGEDGRLVPQNNHLFGVWMPDSFVRSEMWGGGEAK